MGLFGKGNKTQRDISSYNFDIAYVTDTHFIVDKIECDNITKPNIECLINIGMYINCNINSDLFLYISNSHNMNHCILGVDEDNFVDVLVYSSMYRFKVELYSLIKGTNLLSQAENDLISCIKRVLYYTPKELNTDLINKKVLDPARFMYESTDNDIDAYNITIEMINYDKDIIKEDMISYQYDQCCNFDIYVNTKLNPYIYNILPFIDFKIIFSTPSVLLLRMNGNNVKRFIRFLDLPELVFTESLSEELNNIIKLNGSHLRSQLNFILDIPEYAKRRKSENPVVEEVIGEEVEEVIDIEDTTEEDNTDNEQY